MIYEKYNIALNELFDGSSLKKATIAKAKDENYSGKSKDVFALKYIITLPELMKSETNAIKFMQGIWKGKSLGWKSVADVVYLCFTHSKSPITSLRACMMANIDYKRYPLADGSPANVGMEAVNAELKKQTGFRIGHGAYASESKAATKENSKAKLQKLKQRILETLDEKDYDSLTPVDKTNHRCCKFIATNDIDTEKSLMRVLNKATKIKD